MSYADCSLEAAILQGSIHVPSWPMYQAISPEFINTRAAGVRSFTSIRSLFGNTRVIRTSSAQGLRLMLLAMVSIEALSSVTPAGMFASLAITSLVICDVLGASIDSMRKIGTCMSSTNKSPPTAAIPMKPSRIFLREIEKTGRCMRDPRLALADVLADDIPRDCCCARSLPACDEAAAKACKRWRSD